MRARLRTLAASVGYGLGLTQAASRAGDQWRLVRGQGRLSFRRRDVDSFLILMYHRVAEPRPFTIESTSPRAFERQMRYLARHFRVLPLSEIVEGARAGAPIPPRALAITFDDGYGDNYTEAFPILRSLGLPATIFLTTNWLDTGDVPWFDRVLRAFAGTTQDSVVIPGGEQRIPLGEVAARHRLAIQALYALMRFPDAVRLRAQESLIAELAPKDVGLPNAMLRWHQIKEMASAGISFGAHTLTHPILSRLTAEDARRELAESKRRIEDEIQTPVSLLAYPVGRPIDYSPAIRTIARELGYAAAVTTTPGVNLRNDDLFLLRRVKPLGADVPSFALGLALHYLTEWSTAT